MLLDSHVSSVGYSSILRTCNICHPLFFCLVSAFRHFCLFVLFSPKKFTWLTGRGKKRPETRVQRGQERCQFHTSDYIVFPFASGSDTLVRLIFRQRASRIVDHKD